MADTDTLTVCDFELPFADNPFRPPDWRWLAANYYEATPEDRDVRRSSGYAVWRAAGLQGALGTLQGAARSRVLADFYPLGDAYRLYAAARLAAAYRRMSPKERRSQAAPPPAGDPGLLVAELDGYILAGLSDDEAAREAGLDPEMVGSYAETFFDVRGRLHMGGWLSSVVVGSLHGGKPEDIAHALVRAYGHVLKSARVVKAMARAVEVVGGVTPAGLYDAVLEDAKLALSIKASMAARSVKADGQTFRSVLEMQLRRLELDRASGETQGDKKKLSDAIADLFQGGVEVGYNEPPSERLPARLVMPALAAAAPEPSAEAAPAARP